MTHEFITYEKRDHVARVTINRPEVLNALHPPAHLELEAIWNDFRDDPDMRVAILTGAGPKAFCAGADLKDSARRGSPRKGEVTPHGFGGLTSRADLYKPVIAAVNGYALGGGMELVLACDIVVAAEHAEFGMPEPRVGQVADYGGVVRLARTLPLTQAMGIILTGRRIGASEAFRLGLVNEIVPADALMHAAERWCGQVLECSPLAVQAAKEAALRSQDMPLSLALTTRFERMVRLRSSPDGAEGAQAFVQKRKPNWTNA
jgi:crotonobetainyl-CoA hydratase